MQKNREIEPTYTTDRVLIHFRDENAATAIFTVEPGDELSWNIVNNAVIIRQTVIQKEQKTSCSIIIPGGKKTVHINAIPLDTVRFVEVLEH